MKERGLTGTNLKLIITDDLAAITSAAERVYPETARQLCIVNKQRNVLVKTSFKHKREMADDVKAIFRSETKEEAKEKAKTVVKKWYMVEPKAMESLRFNIEYCYTYFSFPKELWTKVRTTNLLEREFREVRRRMKAFDNTFQGEGSANRYANSIFTYLNNNYPLKGGLHTNV